MTIHKNDFTARPLFKEDVGPIKYWIDVQPEQVEIRISALADVKTVDLETGDIQSEQKYVYKFWDIIKLSELEKRPGFVDQTLWTRLNQEFQQPQATEDGEQYANVVTGGLIVDMFAKTLTAKPDTINNHLTDYSDSLYSIFVPDASGDCTTWTVRLRYDSTYQDGYIWEGPSASEIVEGGSIESLLSPINLSSTQTTVGPDSSIKVNVQTDAFIDDIYLEQVYGLLNKSRVKLTNGIGSFTIFTTGMEVGETVRVKAGHKKFTGISSFSIDIT